MQPWMTSAWRTAFTESWCTFPHDTSRKPVRDFHSELKGDDHQNGDRDTARISLRVTRVRGGGGSHPDPQHATVLGRAGAADRPAMRHRMDNHKLPAGALHKLRALARVPPRWLRWPRLLAVVGAVLAVTATFAVLVFLGRGAVLVLLAGLGAIGGLGLTSFALDISTRLRRLDQQVGHLRTDSSKTRKTIDVVANRNQALESVIDGVHTRVEELASEASRIREHLKTLRPPSADYRQVEALFGLYHLLELDQKVPPMRGFAASPDFLLETISQILDRRPRSVLECGSGVSTLLVAYALQRNGTGHLHSLEHDADYAHSTRELLSLHKLAGWATVVHAPLQPIELAAQSWWWYAPDALASLETIDLVVVDGPPTATQPFARYPLLPVVHDKLAGDAVVLVDDYDREDDRAVVARWLEEFDGFTCLQHNHEKGTAVLTR